MLFVLLRDLCDLRDCTGKKATKITKEHGGHEEC